MNKPTIINGGISFDDRGSVSFVNEFDFLNVKRFYCISNIRKNYIRAWHGHKKEAKYLYATNGTFRVGAVDMETEECKVFYLDSRKQVKFERLLKLKKSFLPKLFATAKERVFK